MSREPGMYDGIPDEEYHADKETLSVSGAKTLLPPSCPARFFYDREHGRAPKRAFDIGHAAHAEVLGVGAEVVVVRKTTQDKRRVDAEDYQTKSAQKHRDEIRAEGKTPLLRSELENVKAMAAALRRDPLASALLDPERGKPEQSGYWTDPATGVQRRFRLDWQPDTDGGRLLVPDYKSCPSASKEAISRSVAKFRYFMQDAWYRDGLHALEVAEDIAFLFIFQETVPPYLVNVVELDPPAVEEGRRRNDQALQIYRDCTESGLWPGYAQDVELISLPRWTYFEDAA